MNASKYRHPSHLPTSPTRILSQSDLVGRYSRWLLLGGGVAATLTVIGFSLASATMLLSSFFNERQSQFEVHRDRIKANADRSQARLKQTVESYELLWHMHGGDVKAVRRYEKKIGSNYSISITGPNTTVTPAMLFTLRDYDSADGKVKDFMRLMRDLSAAPLLRYLDVGYFLGGFVYSSDRQMLALSPPFNKQSLRRVERFGVAEYVNFKIDIVEKALNKNSPELIRKQRMVWVPPYISPITGELIGHYAAPIYCRGEKIAVVVATVPLNKFKLLFQDSIEQKGFFVLSSNLEHVLGREMGAADDKLVASALKYKTSFDKSGRRPVITRKGSIFIYSQLIPGPDWVAVYVFDWHEVIFSLKKPLAGGAAMVFLILVALWGFIVFFDRRVLAPLKVYSRLIHESDEFNRAVLSTAPVALTVFDPLNNVVVLQNRQAKKLLESFAEGHGIYQRIVCEKKILDNFEHAIYRPVGAGEVRSFEMSVGNTEGDEGEISVRLSVARYRQSDVVLFGITDISEQKATIRFLEKAKAAADKASNAKSMFLATISHEIRTPLHGALGNLELLALEQTTQKQKGRVSIIRQSFDYLLALVNDVLDLSKIEAQEFILNKEFFRLDELVERCARTFAPIILAKNVRFLCLIDPRLEGSWRGDAQRISQILMNLLSNAQKFTENGSITISVALGQTLEDEQWIHIALSDTGIGISQSNLKKLFEPFVQADQSIGKRFGGTGLGLTLCHRIATAMGGEISIDSELGVGSIFKVNLPLRREEVQKNTPGPQARTKSTVVVIVCDAPLWEINLAAQINLWFPEMEVITGGIHQEPLQRNANTLLMLAMAGRLQPGWWIEPEHSYLDTLVVSADGPLYPERQERALCVTSLDTSMLRLAIAMCAGGRSVDEPNVSRPLASVQSRVARVLIAEDDLISKKLLRCQLEALGYFNVDCVGNGAQALDKCMNNHYEVVITDLGMPVMDGYTFLKKLRAEGILTPVIVSTAGVQEDIGSSYEWEFLQKPITMERLNLLLDQVLGNPSKAGALIAPDELLISPITEMRILFLAGWDDDEKALHHACLDNDRPLFLGLLHRLKGALLALNERAMVEANDRLRVSIESQGLLLVRPDIDVFIEQMREIADAYRAGHP